MRIRAILASVAVLVSSLACVARADNLASGRSVQLDALNGRTGLLVVDEKRLYALDLPSGRTELLVESAVTWFAADRKSGTVLVATRVDGGYDLTLYSLKGDKLVPGVRQFMPVFLCDLQSAKSGARPTFVACGPVGFSGDPKDKVVPWVTTFVYPDESVRGMAVVPVPGMSDVTSFMGSGTVGFAGDEKGTFAYTAVIATKSAAAVKTLPNAADVVDHSAFVVIREGRVIYACPVRTPIQGRCLRFSDDGERLLAHVGLDTGGSAKGPYCRVIDLKTRELSNWSLGDATLVFAVDGSLKRAVIGDYVPKAGATAPAAPEDPMKALVGPPSNGEECEWQVQVRREGRRAVVISELTQKTYDNEAAGTEVGGIFWVTDGKQLFRIDANDRVRAAKILGVTPASRPAAR